MKYINQNYTQFVYVETGIEGYADPVIVQYQLENNCTVLTNDINLQSLCKFKGVNYKNGNKIDPFFEHPVQENVVDLDLLYPNQYVKYTENNSMSYYCYYNKQLEIIKPITLNLKLFKKKISPINIEQKLFVDQFFRDNIELITVTGNQGSGKTFIALACQLYQLEKGMFKHIYFSAPAVQIGGKDKYGYVPGTLEEKASIYAGGFLDNLRYITGLDKIDPDNLVFGNIDIEILPLNTLRGRSLKNTIIILDEQQNATLDELQAIITRQDIGSKLIFMGDVSQTDSTQKYLYNDFAKLITAFKISNYSTHIHFQECLRTNIAKEAIDIFKIIP